MKSLKIVKCSLLKQKLVIFLQLHASKHSPVFFFATKRFHQATCCQVLKQFLLQLDEAGSFHILNIDVTDGGAATAVT